MRHYLLTLALLLVLPFAHGQNTKQETAPRTALEQARREFREALPRGDSPAIVASVAEQFQCLAAIDRDSLPAFISWVEAFTADNPRIVERSLLHSLLAGFYTTYYSSEIGNISDRTPITGYVPRDMSEWTENIYRDKALEHIRLSLAATKELEQTAPADYEGIITLGKDSPRLRPTMYDFLAYRAIDQLTDFRSSLFSNHNLYAKPRYSYSTEEFLRMDITGEQTGDQVMRLYQLLLRSQQNRQADEAFLVTELERLRYLAKHTPFDDNTPELFRQHVKRLCDKYQDDPYSVEAIYALAESYDQDDETPEESIANDREALRLCDDGIRRFPDYFRINLLKRLRDNILRPDHNSSTQLTYPGEDAKIKLDFRNISAVTYTLYRVDSPVETYSPRGKNKVPRQRVLSRSLRLPDLTIRTDTVLSLPVREPGLYEIVLSYQSHQETPADTLTTYCTRLAGIVRNGFDRQEIMVCDRMSGRPVPTARVRLFEYASGDTYRFVREVAVDSNGIAAFDIDKRLAYQAVCDGDTHAPIDDNLTPPRPASEAAIEEISLFTDRDIYRPGQTVYFKGISWKATPAGAQAMTGRRVEVVLRDANRQEVAKQTFTTNEFGSFAGQFTLPSSALSGSFLIEADDSHHFFSVTEYKRPTFEILFDPVRGAYRLGDKIYVSGRVNSFSGIPLDQCKVSYSVKKAWSFDDDERYLAVGELHTTPDGTFEIPVSTDSTHAFSAPKCPLYCNYEIKVEVTAPNGETQSESKPLFATTEAFNIQVFPQKSYNRDTTISINVRTYNQNDYCLRRTLHYKLQALKRLDTPDGLYPRYEDVTGKTWAEGTYTTPVSPDPHPDSLFRLDTRQMPSGAYLLTLTGTGRDSTLSLQKVIYLYSLNDARPPINTYAWTVAVKTTCAIGEEAELIFGTSVDEAHVLYEIYSEGRLLRRERLTLSDENRTFRIPYEQEFGKECEVLFTYLKNDHLACSRFSLQKAQTDHKLNIATSSFRDRLTPGQQETWTFTVKDSDGKAVLAEWLASMYDASLDQFGVNTWYFAPGVFSNLFLPSWRYIPQLWRTEYTSFSLYTQYREKFHIPEFAFDTWSFSPFEYGMNSIVYCRSENAFAGRIDGLPGAQTEAIIPITAQMDEGALPSVVVGSAKQAADALVPIIRPAVRKNFNETAFFYPQLRTDSLGRVVVRFTVPESTTTWHFQAIAHTPDMRYGQIDREIITAKEFMVSANLPRFVRIGDRAVVRATINNQGPARQGEAALELFDPATEQIVSRHAQPFRIAEDGQQTLAFSFDVPEGHQSLGCRIVASAGDFSDGEQHLLPVASDETLITKTVPIFLSQQGTHDFKIKAPKGATPHRLTVELTANPAWYAVLALPGLNEPEADNATRLVAAYYTNTLAAFIAKSNPEITRAIREWNAKQTPATASPLARNEELKSILLQLTPWVTEAQNQTEQMRSLANLFDENRQNYLATVHLGKLRELQLPDGGWSWFKGFRSNTFITLNVLQAFARLTELGAWEPSQEIKEMQTKALRYLDEATVKKHAKDSSASYLDLLYLHVRSACRDIPLGDALTVHKALLADVRRSWPEYDEYGKALAAVALHRYGDTQTAREILASLREFATVTPDRGMFWANNRADAYANSPVLVHAAIMAAFHELEGDSPDTDLMKQWLLCQKQTQDWGDVPSTLEAIHALLLTGSDQLAAEERLAVAINRKPTKIDPADDRLGYVKHTVPADQLSGKATTVSIDKQTDSPSWGGVYLQYFQKLDKAEANTAGVSIDKRLYLKRATADGMTLTPLDSLEPGTLKVGDRITVRLTVRSDRDMEFVHLRDLRAANLEPAAQLPGTQRQGALLYYQETRDVATNFFFDFLPRGTHILEYDAWIAQAGEYTDGVASLQCLYAPQFSANSNGGSLSVPQ